MATRKPCLDNKAHRFIQLRLAKQRKNQRGYHFYGYTFRRLRVEETKLITGQSVKTQRPDPKQFARLFCTKCGMTMTILALEKGADAIASS